MAEQVLRQAKNEVKVVGIAEECTLAKHEFKDKVTGAPYNAISGDVTLKIKDEESQVISYFEKELTKKGAVNKNYKSLTTAMDKMITTADIAQGLTDEDAEPSKIECSGSLELNEFKASDGNVISFPRIGGSYSPQTFKGTLDQFEASAKFDVEGIVKSVEPEMDKDENETGRLKIQLFVPVYNGKVIPLTFVTNPSLVQAGKDYLSENFVPRSSVRVYGDLVNISKKIVRKVEAGFGEDKEDISYERTREFVASGGTLYEDGVHKEVFDISLLKEAIANRNRFLSTLKEQEVKKDDKKTGFGEGSQSVNTAPQTNTAPKDDSLDDIFGED